MTFETLVLFPHVLLPRLSGTKFCVFGLGDSTYSQFCVAAAGLDARGLAADRGKLLLPGSPGRHSIAFVS